MKSFFSGWRWWWRQRGVDWGLWLAPLALIGIGLAILYGTSLNDQSGQWSLVSRQLVWLAIAAPLAISVALIDYRFWRHSVWLMYGLAVISLLAVLLFGTEINAHKAWFVFGKGLVSFQPVEWVKVILVVALSYFFAVLTAYRRRWWPVVTSLLLTLILVGLVLKQPDLGSAVVLLVIWLSLLVARGLPRKQAVVLGLGVVLVAVVTWFGLLQDYQKERLISFVNPQADIWGSGYNVNQAVIAVGSGGWFGRGIGLGPQSQLKFLPVRTTDFIFAVIAEELGLVGSLAVLGLYGWLLWRLLEIARQAPDDFGGFLVVGIAAMFFSHVVINIGMNIGLVPVTGIPLPLVSYGGSSLTAYLAAIGLAQSVAKVRVFSAPT